MAEILGIGATHYPPGLIPEELKPYERLRGRPNIWGRAFNAPKCLAVFKRA